MKTYILITVCLLFFYSFSFSQCKTFRTNDKGDTLNCTDFKDKKQGKWINHYDQLRGEPGFEEEGEYLDNLKTGRWRKFSLYGDLIAVENYQWGNKDGIQQYFYQGELEREESWRAINPEKKFDTVDVPSVNDPYKVERKIIKIDVYSMKEGVWKYYKPGSMSLIKTETYILDKLQIPKSEFVSTNTSDTSSNKIHVKKVKPATVQDFEKKNSGKKAYKYKDGATGL